MAAAFRPVNSGLPPESITDDAGAAAPIITPTTPRPSSSSYSDQPKMMLDDPTTPTLATFGAAMAAQKPLPTSPFPEAVLIPTSSAPKAPKRENSQHSRHSGDSDGMDESDGEGAGEDGVASDDESVDADGTRPSKKKKSQRFYCTDYPPCSLSFTRSEHLARHIRKHTGERPFQCHCSRRFSRLDNLRQHAQTVHINEEIPVDSLAATGTRFQRQIRTDKLRQGGRARASTAGSNGSTGRGHSKSLSTSSITSIGSVGSNFSSRDEMRRRPPPLVMADPRTRLSLESYPNTRDGHYPFRGASPTDFSTPTSATFSTGQNSPRWGSGVVSPTSSHSRSQSMYTVGSRTPSRRLSVPSGGNPFQSPHVANVGRPAFPSSQTGMPNGPPYSPAGSSILASPTASTTSTWSRRDSLSSAAEEAWRRRTWHPDSNNFGSSRLSNVITPSQFPSAPAPPPLALSNIASQGQQSIRLPGIESFDPIPHRPATPPRRNPSPMMIDSETPNPPALLPSTESGGDDRRVQLWDMGLHRGLTRLDINTPPRDTAGSWASEANQAVPSQGEQAVHNAPGPAGPTHFGQESNGAQGAPSQNLVPTSSGQAPSTIHKIQHQHTMSAPVQSRENKRHGWYHGAVTIHPPREPGGPGRPHVDRIVHPNMHSFVGFPARQQMVTDLPTHQEVMERDIDRSHPSSTPDPLRRLEALVAVATSEGSTATAY